MGEILPKFMAGEAPPAATPPQPAIDSLSPEIRKRLTKAFSVYDVDHDSRLSKDEIGNLIEDAECGQWEAIQTDKDGFMVLEELCLFTASIQQARGEPRMEEFVADFEAMDPRYSLTKEQKDKIKVLFGADSLQSLENPLTGFKASHAAGELDQMLMGLQLPELHLPERPAIDAAELLAAMSIFVALREHLQKQAADADDTAADADNALVEHDQFDCHSVKELFPGDITLVSVIDKYQSLSTPPEDWMSECGLVLTVMQLNVTGKLTEEVRKSIGQGGLADAHQTLDKRNPKQLNRKCTLCGLADCNIM